MIHTYKENHHCECIGLNRCNLAISDQDYVTHSPFFGFNSRIVSNSCPNLKNEQILGNSNEYSIVEYRQRRVFN